MMLSAATHRSTPTMPAFQSLLEDGPGPLVNVLIFLDIRDVSNVCSTCRSLRKIGPCVWDLVEEENTMHQLPGRRSQARTAEFRLKHFYNVQTFFERIDQRRPWEDHYEIARLSRTLLPERLVSHFSDHEFFVRLTDLKPTTKTSNGSTFIWQGFVPAQVSRGDGVDLLFDLHHIKDMMQWESLKEHLRHVNSDGYSDSEEYQTTEGLENLDFTLIKVKKYRCYTTASLVVTTQGVSSHTVDKAAGEINYSMRWVGEREGFRSTILKTDILSALPTPDDQFPLRGIRVSIMNQRYLY